MKKQATQLVRMRGIRLVAGEVAYNGSSLLETISSALRFNNRLKTNSGYNEYKRMYSDIEPIKRSKSMSSLLKDYVFEYGQSGDYPFYIVDIGEIIRKHEQWVSLLPRIRPFYAVKCNGDERILRLLSLMGLGFDCASLAEMQSVLELGTNTSRIIFANPCKQISHIRYSADNDITKMTFDNADELIKIKENHPKAELVLRVLTDNSRSVCNLGLKFGTPIERVEELLKLAKKLRLNVIGISFHVGSGCFDSGAFADAVSVAKTAFQYGENAGYEFSVLDVGGGFPGSKDENGVAFEEVARVLNKSLDENFPKDEYPDLEIIAEPGRFYASASHNLAVGIHSKRAVHSGDGVPSQYKYYINDGTYGSFNCLIYDHAVVKAEILHRQSCGSDTEYPSSVWGPTCDSMDCVLREVNLPELSVGDWLYFRNMGAYTVAASSTFNGMPKPRMFYVNSEHDRDHMPDNYSW